MNGGEVRSRLRAAWLILRRGVVAPPPAGRPETIAVPVSELRDMTRKVCVLVGLPHRWVEEAMEDELRAVADSIDVEIESRNQAWAHLELGRWPALEVSD